MNMRIMIVNGAGYAVEYMKLFLVAAGVLGCGLKRWVMKAFFVSLLCVTVTAHWIDMSVYYSISYCLAAIVIVGAALQDKKKMGWVILSFLMVSAVDMMIAIAGIYIARIDIEEMENPYIVLFLNMVSLIPILLICVWRKRKDAVWIPNRYVSVFIIGFLGLSYYLTSVMLMEMGEFSMREYGGMGAVVLALVFFAVCYLLMAREMENEHLRYENDLTQYMLQAQHDYFTMLLERDQETRAFRHDVRGHIMCMLDLCEKGKQKEMSRYLQQMDASVCTLSREHITGNPYVDVVIKDMDRQFPDVQLNWMGHIPGLTMAEMDICTLFCNLLKNACEAASENQNPIVTVGIRTRNTTVVVEVSNPYDKVRRSSGNTFLSTKEGKGHGYGLKNIERCVEKYGGSCQMKAEDGVFSTEIVLSDVIEMQENI